MRAVDGFAGEMTYVLLNEQVTLQNQDPNHLIWGLKTFSDLLENLNDVCSMRNI